MTHLTLGRRDLLLGAGGLAAAASLTACGLSSSDNTSNSASSVNPSANLTGTITFQTWSLKGDRFTPYFTKLVNDYQSAHSGVTIKWVDQPGDGYEDKVLQQAGSGELPDVVNRPTSPTNSPRSRR